VFAASGKRGATRARACHQRAQRAVSSQRNDRANRTAQWVQAQRGAAACHREKGRLTWVRPEPGSRQGLVKPIKTRRREDNRGTIRRRDEIDAASPSGEISLPRRRQRRVNGVGEAVRPSAGKSVPLERGKNGPPPGTRNSTLGHAVVIAASVGTNGHNSDLDKSPALNKNLVHRAEEEPANPLGPMAVKGKREIAQAKAAELEWNAEPLVRDFGS
jgi:hypothetical protein